MLGVLILIAIPLLSAVPALGVRRSVGGKASNTDFGFSIGDSVYWMGFNDPDIPPGTSGEVVSFSSDKVFVKFPAGSWDFEPSQLTLQAPDLDEIQCPSSAFACECTTAKKVTELPLLKPGLVQPYGALTHVSFYVNPTGFKAYKKRSDVQIQCKQFFHRGGLDYVPCDVCENTDGPFEHAAKHAGSCFDGPAHRAAGAIPGMCLNPSVSGAPASGGRPAPTFDLPSLAPTTAPATRTKAPTKSSTQGGSLEGTSTPTTASATPTTASTTPEGISHRTEQDEQNGAPNVKDEQNGAPNVKDVSSIMVMGVICAALLSTC